MRLTKECTNGFCNSTLTIVKTPILLKFNLIKTITTSIIIYDEILRRKGLIDGNRCIYMMGAFTRGDYGNK